MDIKTSYLVFGTGLGYVHCGIRLYIVYVTCSRMIVLYSWYRVDRGIHMFVVFVNVTLFLFSLPLRLGSECSVSQPVGRSPPCISAPQHFGFKAKMAQISDYEILERSNLILSSTRRCA